MTRLTFHKAFGLAFIDVEYTVSLLQLKDAALRVDVNGTVWIVSSGSYGHTPLQKKTLARLGTTVGLIPTMVLSTETDLVVPGEILGRREEPGIADRLVKDYVEPAFRVYRRVSDAQRDLAYERSRLGSEWPRGEEPFFLPARPTRRAFSNLLFYVLNPEEIELSGVFISDAAPTLMVRSDDIERLRPLVSAEIPLEQVLMVAAWEFFLREDYRSTVVYVATSMEMLLTRIVRRGLLAANLASGSRVDKFVADTSKRLLATITLGQLGVGERALRERFAAVFELRNQLLHGGREHASAAEASDALAAGAQLLDLAKTFGSSP